LRNLKGNLEGLDDHSGKVIVVNFWATWWVPCVKEMPSFENLYRRYRSQGLTLLAVSLDKGGSTKVQEFANKHKLSFPILLDTKGVAEKLYPSFSIPFTYVIDKQGRVVARVDGAKNWESSETFEAVEHLLKQ
jgi:peroxiredoxin